MGISSDGILLYGVCWEDEDSMEALGDLAKDAAEGYGDGREWFEEVGLTNLTLVRHCSFDYSMPAIAVVGTVTQASRGRPKLVAPSPGQHKWDVELDRAMELLGLPVKGRPAKGWWLTSMFG